MSSSTGPTRTGRPPRLTSEQVFARALQLLDEGSGGSFSMRKLGESLQVNPMTLYTYADSKDAIVEGAARLAFAAVHEPAPPEAPWDDQIRAAMREVHLVCSRHPNLAALVVGRPGSPGTFRVRERVLATLLSAGFDESRALHALGILAYYTLGFAGAQAARAAHPEVATLPRLSASEFPVLHHLKDRYVDHVSDVAFEYGLDLIIDALRRELPPRRAGTTSHH